MRQRRGAVGRPLGRHDVAVEFLDTALRQARVQQLQASGNAGQEIVEIVGEAAGELAYGFHLLALAKGLLDALTLGQGGGDALFQRLVGIPQRSFGALLLGDVVAFGENAGNGAVALDDRLVHQIEDPLLQRRARLALDVHAHLAAHEGLSGAEHLVEQIEKALAGDLRKGFVDRQSRQIAVADELQIGLVHEFEHMVRSAQHAHETGRALEQVAQPVALGRPQPRPPSRELAFGLFEGFRCFLPQLRCFGEGQGAATLGLVGVGACETG